MIPLLPAIEKLAPYAPGLSIAEIRDRFHLNQVIKLASNENPLGIPPLAQDAIMRHAASAFRYPQGGNPRLAKAIAGLHNVAPEQILIGNGSDEIIDLLIRMTCGPEHNIVCFQPCFSIYPIQAAINGVEARRQALEPDFSFDFEKLLVHADARTRLIFITTPDNPSGYCPPAGAVADLAEAMRAKTPDALLVIDEAYMDFAPDERRQSLLAAGKMPGNTVFLRTFSKSYGLAGLRIGYAIAPEQIAAAFWKTRLPFSLNILAEEAALAALDDTAFRSATLEAVSRGRADLSAALEALGCQVWQSSANFIMFELPHGFDARQCFDYLLQKGIIIRPLRSYGLPEKLRVSVGNHVENAAFLTALGEFLKK